MSRAGDFVDHTVAVESKMQQLRRPLCPTVSNQIAMRQMRQHYRPIGNGALDVSAILLRAAPSCGPRQPRTGDVGITNGRTKFRQNLKREVRGRVTLQSVAVNEETRE